MNRKGCYCDLPLFPRTRRLFSPRNSPPLFTPPAPRRPFPLLGFLAPSTKSLPKEAQACLAGDMQRVAKLLATKADYEVIREVAKLDTPEQTGHDWDER